MYFDIIIKNGTIYDGTGAKGVRADLGVSNDIIGAIGNLNGADAREIVNASGKIVCPGFIDTHSHSGMCALVEPASPHNIRQGITTCVVGQDGMGPAPIKNEFVVDWKKSMAGLEGSYDIDWSWRTTADYLERLEANNLGPNFAYLAPHGNLRLVVMGLKDREPTDEEISQMKVLLARTIEEGAFGMSTGMIYPPCSFAKTAEFIELGKVLHEYGVVFVTHQRSESDDILNSMEEIMTIGKQSGCRIHFSHFKVAGKRNWDKFPEVMRKLDMCSEKGIPVSIDQYPYVAGSTTLSVLLPPWAHDGGAGEMLKRLADHKARKQITKDILQGIPGWENFVQFAGIEGIYITFVSTDKNRDIVGKNLAELGEMRGKDPLEATYDLLLEEEGAVGIIDFYGLEDQVKDILRRPEQNVCTDGILGGKPHPRVYGTCPRILGKYVREENVLDVATAIYKMTGKPASVLGVNDRGILKKGYAADIVVFDPEKIVDKADYSDPIQFPEGIDHVLVNGKTLVSEGVHKPQKAGRILRYEGRS